MKNKLPTILLTLSLTSLVGFTAGSEIELDAFLNARTNPSFMNYSKNIATTLPAGTTGQVLEIKKFETGNSGIKIKVTNGPQTDKSYWVYYNAKNPSIKLANIKTNSDIPIEKVEIETTGRPRSILIARSVSSVNARREMDEHSVEQSAQLATQTIQTIQTGDLQNRMMPERPPCPLSESSSNQNLETYSPQAALADINSGDLKFIGRDLMPGFGENKTCIYQNEKVYVLYNHCMANKKEFSTTDIEVISKQGGTIRFYVEIFDAPKKISQLKRNEYDRGTFTISHLKTKRPGDLNVQKTKEFLTANVNTMNACYIGTDFKVADMSTTANCMGELAEKRSDWAASAESFWKNPPQEWYETQSKLRKLVETTSF